jgi:hypothetical protein
MKNNIMTFLTFIFAFLIGLITQSTLIYSAEKLEDKPQKASSDIERLVAQLTDITRVEKNAYSGFLGDHHVEARKGPEEVISVTKTIVVYKNGNFILAKIPLDPILFFHMRKKYKEKKAKE